MMREMDILLYINPNQTIQNGETKFCLQSKHVRNFTHRQFSIQRRMCMWQLTKLRATFPTSANVGFKADSRLIFYWLTHHQSLFWLVQTCLNLISHWLRPAWSLKPPKRGQICIPLHSSQETLEIRRCPVVVREGRWRGRQSRGLAGPDFSFLLGGSTGF